jgi:FkbM family methyltransferase
LIDRKLVFDLGAHHGLDTRRYLAEGFKVVALEANPDCIEAIDKALAFQREDYSGRLQLVERALHSLDRSTVKLYPSESPKGETHSLFPHRVKQCDGVPYEVKTVTLGALLSEYGVPWYMKIDIEGSDVVAIRQLHEWQQGMPAFGGKYPGVTLKGGAVPPYLSVELDWEHPEEAIEMFSLLGYMGYTSFSLVQQWDPANGPTTVMPNEVTYSCTLMQAISIWASDGSYKGWWFDLHARHKDHQDIAP